MFRHVFFIKKTTNAICLFCKWMFVFSANFSYKLFMILYVKSGLSESPELRIKSYVFLPERQQNINGDLARIDKNDRLMRNDDDVVLDGGGDYDDVG